MKASTSPRAVLLALACLHVPISEAADPLPSWNDGAAKRAIQRFVERVSDTNSPEFVPASGRVAVFDNDGTLWPENPFPFQVMFALDELKRMAPDHPEWADDPVLSKAMAGDRSSLKAGGAEALLRVLAASHAGLTTDEFVARVRTWMSTARHPRFDRPYDELAYQPMLEVLDLLRTGGFKVYIVSGGGADFMRVWAEKTYGIPPERVIGSIGPVRFELQESGPVLVKEPGVTFVDDKAGKPIAIHRHLGRRPIACFGNSDGDLQMLQWTTVGRAPSFGLILHHTDATREYAYDAHPQSTGKLVEALLEAPRRNWTVVDMRRDWRGVFSN